MTKVATGLTNAFGEPLGTLVRGQGAYVWDSDDKKFLDFLAGIAVNALGHAHPRFVAAVSDQVATLGHVSNFFTTPPQIELAQKLTVLADLGWGSEVFFTNSGTEANEAAFKLVRLHGNKTGRNRLVAFEGAFHGRTLGALALTANAAYRTPFEPLPGPVTFIPRTARALDEALEQRDVAGVFMEPLQGEAGVHDMPDKLVAAARELTLRHDALLVVDEVQTGIGRTGQWFWHHGKADGPRADIVTVAKGLGGGVPIGAAIAGPRAAGLLYPGSHGTTFGGNPLATRAALTVLDVIESEGLMANARLRGRQLTEGVLALGSPLVKEVTGAGLLLGIQLHHPVAKQIAKDAYRLGLIVNAPQDHTVRLAPPLVIDDSHVEEFLDLFGQALKMSEPV